MYIHIHKRYIYIYIYTYVTYVEIHTKGAADAAQGEKEKAEKAATEADIIMMINI